MANPFDFVNAISNTKVDLIRDSDDPSRIEKEYNAWIVNKGLSYFTDTLFYANDMNMYPALGGKLQFYYLLNTIRPKKRFAKWVKKVSEDDLELVKSYYGYNNEKAKQAISILSDAQLAVIRKRQEQGGINE